MSNKIKLGQRPEAFKAFAVKFTMPDGTEEAIEVTFKYRTRKEFGKMLNEMFANAGRDKPSEGPTDFELLFAGASSKNAEHLLYSIKSWNLEIPLNKESVEGLCDEYPAAAVALMGAYSGACNEGRLGN